MLTTYQLLLKIFDEKLGIIVPNDLQDDFSISDYVVDSISFIQFIIAIEEELEVELPDDFLLPNILDSAKGFTEKLDFFLDSKK